MASDDLTRLARRFFEAYGNGDLAAVSSALADDVVAYVTNADGGAFASFLARVRDGRVTKLWMVEAHPAESDEFWS
jgi:hypothetical protein